MSIGAIGQYAIGEIAFEETGIFRLSGQDADLVHFVPNKGRLGAIGELAIGELGEVGTYFAVQHGTFTLTGQDLGTDITRGLPCDVGTFTLTGQDASLTTDNILEADYGSFTLSGQDITLAQTHLDLTADYGSFTLTGQDITFRTGYLVPLDVGTFTLSGQDIEFARVSRRIRLNLRGGTSSNIRLRAA